MKQSEFGGSIWGAHPPEGETMPDYCECDDPCDDCVARPGQLGVCLICGREIEKGDKNG